MNSRTEEYLKQQASLGTAALKRAAAALDGGRGQEFESELRQYILRRYVLFDADTGGTDGIDELSELSIEHILRITDGDIKSAGIVMGCGGATTATYKKIELLFDMQKLLGVKLDPKRTPYLETIADVAGEIFRLKTAQRKAAAEKGLDPEYDRVQTVRNDFPALRPERAGVWTYLDNAATMQVPSQVLSVQTKLYADSYANVHRGSHSAGNRATEIYESAREKAAHFIGADADEVIFTAGATAGLNMAAISLSELVGPGDRVVVTAMEHHSNYLPWAELCRRRGAGFACVPVTAEGALDMDVLDSLLSPPTVILAFTHCSNVLGTVNPVEKICRRAAERGIITVVDGAQGIRHEAVDVHRFGCDLYAFSGHKIMSGSGIGVLYGKRELLGRLTPPMSGGGMVDAITHDGPVWAAAPHGWEAGTPNIAGAAGLAAAIDYLRSQGTDWIHSREAMLHDLLRRLIADIDGVRVISGAESAGCVTFTVDGMASQDAASALDLRGIAVRGGHHCAIPLHSALGITGSVRASAAFYNTTGEIKKLADTLADVVGCLRR